MKIAFVTELFSPSLVGQEMRYLELGRRLLGSGHTVSVYTIRHAAEPAAHETVEGIEVYRVVNGFKYLRSVIDWCEPRATAAWRVIYRFMANPQILRPAVSEAVAEQLKVRYGLPPARVGTAVSGVDAARFCGGGGERRDRTLLYLGRLVPHKDPMAALNAFVSAGLGRRGYALHVAGDGPLLHDLERAARGTSGVEVHGPVTEVQKIRLLRHSTLLVLPSRREGFPRVVAEATAAGTPALTVSYPENGTEAVLATCRGRGVERFFMASTAAVYKSAVWAHLEGDPVEAIDVYARTKLAKEEQIQEAARSRARRFAVGRISNTAGAYETTPRLIPELMKRLLASGRIEIGNATTRRDNIHARDSAAAIIRMTFGLDSATDVCNIGSGVARSGAEIVHLLSNTTGRRVELVCSKGLMRRVDPPVILTDSSRLRNRYGWAARYTLDDALREAWDFAREASAEFRPARSGSAAGAV